MAKYDYTRLKTFCDGKNITLVGRDYSKERINAHTKIEFNCVELDCVSTHIKNMESFITGAGAYCRKHELQHRAVMQRTNIRKIPFKKSIAYTHPEIAKQWHPIKNEELKPEQFSFGSEKEFWWICPKQTDCGCVHEYEMMICNKIKSDCSFCCIPRKKHCIHESILYTHSKLLEQWHPTKNGDLKPEHFTYGSNENIWWFDEKCNHEWKTAITNRSNGSGCPYCVNKTEQKLYHVLISHYPQLKTQFKVDWCMNNKQLPFDFVLEEYKIIIELDGLQHFEQVSNWQAPEETHLNDVYKMKCANENGYSVIRLLQTDVFYDTYDWLREVSENIEKIKLEKQLQNVYMCKNNEYEVFNISSV